MIVWLILIGMVSGVFVVTSPGTLVMLAIVGWLLVWLRRRLPEDGVYVSWLIGIGFVTRAVLAFLLLFAFTATHPVGQPHATSLPPIQRYYEYRGYSVPDILGESDSAFYSLQGLWLAQGVARSHPNEADQRWLRRVLGDPLTRSYHVYLIGAYHYVFGFSPYSVLLLNGLIGTFGGLLVYLFSRHLFDRSTARLAGLLAMFWPSLMFWSLTNLKDPSVILAILVFCWALSSWFKYRKWRYMLIGVLAGCAQVIVRKELFVVVIPLLALSVSYRFFQGRNTSWGRRVAGITVILIVVLQLLSNGQFIRGPLDRLLESMVRLHLGNQQGWAYQYLDDQYYLPTAADVKQLNDLERLKTVGRAWMHFLFEPFPQRLDTMQHVFLYPQALLWYGCVIFALFGMIVSWHALPRGGLFLCLVYLVGFGSLVALASGNIGTVFRHRDMFSPMYLSFVAAWFSRLNQRVLSLK